MGMEGESYSRCRVRWRGRAPEVQYVGSVGLVETIQGYIIHVSSALRMLCLSLFSWKISFTSGSKIFLTVQRKINVCSCVTPPQLRREANIYSLYLGSICGDGLHRKPLTEFHWLLQSAEPENSSTAKLLTPWGALSSLLPLRSNLYLN